MAAPPEGTVTLLFTDIEGSTRLLRETADAYADVLLTHRRLLRESFTAHGGYEVDTAGDGFFVAFASANEAVAAADAAQRALAAYEWPERQRVWVRMGLHTGEPRLLDGNYIGLDVHHAARVMAAGHGGQVLLSQSTRELLDEHTPLRDLGEHRLKDLSSPQRLYQVQVEGLPHEFPALKTLENRPMNLPVQATPLIGRERELEEIAALLLREDVRLLTLAGPGGIGKTRLALQAAANVIDEFANGVYFVSLAPVRDPGLVIPAVAQTLGLRDQPGRSLAETLREYLSEKVVLLVLDNLEQVIEAAPEIAAVLGAAPRTRVLATSREPLRIAGEHLYEVPPLSLPTGTDDFATLAGIESVRLFVSRGRAVQPEFDLSAANGAQVAELVRRLDGLPLAIELAAARVRVLSPQAILDRLGERLKLLTGGGRDQDERQRTLRATIQWSYDLLTPQEQTLFARLGVFVGGCRLEAAEAVCHGDLAIDVFDGVASLVNKSLVRRRDDADGQPRFWMLETIREYAEARLGESGERPEVRDRHAHYVSAYAESADRTVVVNREAAWLDRLDREQLNIRAALDHLFERQQFQQLATLSVALTSWWYLRGHLREGRARLETILQTGADFPPALRRTALREAALLAHRTGDYAEAAELSERFLTLARACGEPGAVAEALLATALMAESLGETPRAVRDLNECIATAESAGAERVLAMAHGNRGDIEMVGSNYQEAQRHFAEAHRLFEKLGDKRHVGLSLANLGLLAVRENHDPEGWRFLLEALTIAESLGDKEAIIWCLGGVAALAARAGDTASAATALGISSRLREETGHAPQRDQRELEQETLASLQVVAGEVEIDAALQIGRELPEDRRISFALALAAKK